MVDDGVVGRRLPTEDGIEPPLSTGVDLWSLGACLAGNFLLRAAASAGGTLIALYLASLAVAGMSVHARMVGLAGVLFYVAELIGSPGFGILSDLRGRKPFMMLGPGFGAVAVGFILMAPTIPLILLARTFQGLSTASSVPSTLSYLSAETGSSEKLRGRVMGIYEVATIVGMASGFAIGGILWDSLHQRAFVAVFGLYLASGMLLWAIRDRHAIKTRASRLTDSFVFLKSKTALQLVPAWVAVNAIVGLWFSHLAFQMGKADDPTQLLVGGFSGKQIGLYTAGFSILFVFGIGAWTATFGRLRATQIMAISLSGLVTLVAGLAALNHLTDADHTQIRLMLIVIGASLFVISGFTPAALAFLAGLAEEFPDVRGSVMGLYSVFLGVGQLIGSGLGGYFADWRGVDGMIVFTAILGVVSAFCVYLLARQQRGAPSRADRQPALPTRLH